MWASSPGALTSWTARTTTATDAHCRLGRCRRSDSRSCAGAECERARRTRAGEDVREVGRRAAGRGSRPYALSDWRSPEWHEGRPVASGGAYADVERGIATTRPELDSYGWNHRQNRKN